MIAKIEQLLKEVEALHASNAEELEALRIKYLSKKGAINDLMADFRNVAAEQKKEVGMRLNELKTKAQDKINALKELFESQDNDCDGLDLTRSAYPVELGTRHPLTIVKNEIIDIFARLGFSIAEGPEIEDDWHVFSALNFAEDHPARDMQDTFFIEAHPDVVLRTHTSSVQTRVMETSQPPIRIICPGRVYRNEAISYRAHCFFHQVEALYVDKNVSFTDLKQVLLLFAKEMFGADTKIRLRPSYFPFTEPSAEMDISCNICGGKGCPFCKHTGWVEILGCGMVDPNVLESNGIDSKVYSGYALGMGIERILYFLEKEGVEYDKLNLMTINEVPQNAECLLEYIPVSDITKTEAEVLTKYLENGGKLLLITGISAAEMPNLGEVMSGYGLASIQGLIMEGDGNHCIPSYQNFLLPEIKDSAVTSSFVSKDELLLLPNSHAITVLPDVRSTVDAQEILTTSKSSWLKTDTSDLSYKKGDLTGPFAVGVLASEPVGDDQTRIAWFSSDSLMVDEIDEMVSGNNKNLILNTIGWMTEQDNNIAIRAKNTQAVTLRLTSAQVMQWSIVYLAVIPGIVLAAGIIFCVRRRRRQ